MKSKSKRSLKIDKQSIITSSLKKHREKKGLYIIAVNSSKYLSTQDFEYLRKSAYSLSKYLLKDPQNRVGVMPLNDEFKYFNKDKFHQGIEKVAFQISSLQQTLTQPVTVLNNFIKNWRKENKIMKNFDVFVVVLSPSITFNPEKKFYKMFTDKKLTVFPILYGTSFLQSQQYALQFTSPAEMNEQIEKLFEKTETLMSSVEFYPENNAVGIRFITSYPDPEFEITIYRVIGDNFDIVQDFMVVNKKEIRIADLEPDTQYVLKYRFHFSDGLNSQYFEEVQFSTLSSTAKDLGIMAPDQVKKEHNNHRQSLISFQASPIESLMGVNSYNVLLFGRIGAGKSSLASTINRSITGVFNPNFAYVDFSYKSCTKELNKLELINCSPIKIWDTFGLDDKNYDNQLLEAFLDGKVRDQHKPEDNISGEGGKLNSMVHAVLLVVDVNIFSDDDDLDQLRTKVDKIKEKRYYPVMVITKLDTLQKHNEFPITCQTMYKHKSSNDILQKAHQTFRIDKNNIFFMINYRGEEPQDFYKELLSLRILKRCVDRAHQFISQRKKILVRQLHGDAQKVFPISRNDISFKEFRDLYGKQIAKMLKVSSPDDFIFAECENFEDENDNFLNEIEQADEEFGERIKFITVQSRKVPPINHNLRPPQQQFQADIDSSINDRASVSRYRRGDDIKINPLDDYPTVHSSSIRGQLDFSEESKGTISKNQSQVNYQGSTTKKMHVQQQREIGSDGDQSLSTSNLMVLNNSTAVFKKVPSQQSGGSNNKQQQQQQESINSRQDEIDDDYDMDYPNDFDEDDNQFNYGSQQDKQKSQEELKYDDENNLLDGYFGRNQSPIPSSYQQVDEPSDIEEIQDIKESQQSKKDSDESTKARLVINGIEKNDFISLNGSLSIYSVRKEIEANVGLQDSNFSFVRKLNGQDYLIPGHYANESAVKLEKVVEKKDNEYRINIKVFEASQ